MLLTNFPFRSRYEKLDYGVHDVESDAGGPVALSSDKATVLMVRMRYPTLSIHGIEGAFSAPGGKTVIPAKVTGKFSLRYVQLRPAGFVHPFYPLRLVPDQTPEKVGLLVRAYVESEFAKLNTRNKLQFEDHHGGKPWLADPNHWNYRAAIKATEVTGSGLYCSLLLTCCSTLQRRSTNKRPISIVKGDLFRSPSRSLMRSV
jgi:Cys-Gly metallodipeptidase DUG1